MGRAKDLRNPCNLRNLRDLRGKRNKRLLVQNRVGMSFIEDAIRIRKEPEDIRVTQGTQEFEQHPEH